MNEIKEYMKRIKIREPKSMEIPWNVKKKKKKAYHLYVIKLEYKKDKKTKIAAHHSS